jgi:hypothetical protein
MTTLQFLLILTPFLLAIGLLVFLLHKQMMLNATTADALRTETIKYAEAINEVQVFSERNARLIEENANHERKLVALATDFDEYKYNYKNVSTALNEWIKKYESLESERVMTQGQAEQLQNLLADYRLKFANLEETNRDLAHQLTKYEAKPLTDAIQTLKNEVNGATNKYEEGCINTIKFIRDELQKEIDNYEESAGRAISKKQQKLINEGVAVLESFRDEIVMPYEQQFKKSSIKSGEKIYADTAEGLSEQCKYSRELEDFDDNKITIIDYRNGDDLAVIELNDCEIKQIVLIVDGKEAKYSFSEAGNITATYDMINEAPELIKKSVEESNKSITLDDLKQENLFDKYVTKCNPNDDCTPKNIMGFTVFPNFSMKEEDGIKVATPEAIEVFISYAAKQDENVRRAIKNLKDQCRVVTAEELETAKNVTSEKLKYANEVVNVIDQRIAELIQERNEARAEWVKQQPDAIYTSEHLKNRAYPVFSSDISIKELELLRATLSAYEPVDALDYLWEGRKENQKPTGNPLLDDMQKKKDEKAAETNYRCDCPLCDTFKMNGDENGQRNKSAVNAIFPDYTCWFCQSIIANNEMDEKKTCPNCNAKVDWIRSRTQKADLRGMEETNAGMPVLNEDQFTGE